TPPRTHPIFRFLLILSLVLAALWGVVGIVLAPLIPGGWAAFAVMAVLVTFGPPVLVLLIRGRGGYVGRWTRLLLLRPFWYLLLALLLLGPLAILGALMGAL